MLFLLPGSNTTIRLNGKAIVTLDTDLLLSFEKEGKRPRSAIVVTTGEIYTQCGRAVVRADLWNPNWYLKPNELPTPGAILAEQTEGRVGGEDYDKAWPTRAARTMW